MQTIVFSAHLDIILILMEFVRKLVINVVPGAMLREHVHLVMVVIGFMDQLAF
jgi:hypothetical protein